MCLDKGDAMEPKVKGQHVALVNLSGLEKGSRPPQKLTVAVHLSNIRKESLLLRLDSGINVPLLYRSRETADLMETGTTPLRSQGTDGIEHAFAVLGRQDVQVGPHTLHEIPFVVPEIAASTPKPEVDGLLPTALFQRVYISYAHHYAVLEP